MVSGVQSNVSGGVLDTFDRTETMQMWWVAVKMLYLCSWIVIRRNRQLIAMSLKQHYNKIFFVFVVFRMLEMKSCRSVSIDCAMATPLAICSWCNSETSD